MKNFIFISPDFPPNYWKFCRYLNDNGFNVLGIGDCPYGKLSDELICSLKEYYKVGSLENYDEVYRAVAFFAFKYGKIDFLESNNEYWLERDSNLRTDFNITTGFLNKDVKKIKLKSEMKKYFQRAGVKVAKYIFVKSISDCRKFIEKTAYPVIVKPDNGVGANATFKISDDGELSDFFKKDFKNYIMEEFIDGEVNSYDAIIDSRGNPVFETGNITPNSVMDIVNNADNCLFYIVKEIADDVREAGRRTVKAFGVKSRFVHFEYFRLLSDQRIGKKGEIVALEVNMRPSGGVSPEMMNFANSTDVYKIWADVMAYDKTGLTTGEKFFCGFAGRREGKNFRYSHQELMDMYGKSIKMNDRTPDILSGAMGNLLYVAAFKTEAELKKFFKDATCQI